MTLIKQAWDESHNAGSTASSSEKGIADEVVSSVPVSDEEGKYVKGKPYRIIVRAKIIHDPNQ